VAPRALNTLPIMELIMPVLDTPTAGSLLDTDKIDPSLPSARNSPVNMFSNRRSEIIRVTVLSSPMVASAKVTIELTLRGNF